MAKRRKEMPESYYTLRTQVRRHLERTGWSETQLAHRAGIAQSSLNRTLRPGAENSPTLYIVAAIAEALGVPVWSLYLDGAPVDPVQLDRLQRLVETWTDLDPASQRVIDEVVHRFHS